MKKIIKVLALTAAFMLMFSSCGKKKNDNKNSSASPSEKQEQQLNESGENKKPSDEKSENKSSSDKNNTETKKEDKKTSANKNEKSDTGMFLGMDDSNFLVIFSASEKKDVHFKIDPSLNFQDSDIELGSPVNYRYTVSETDEKTLTFIEAAKTEQ